MKVALFINLLAAICIADQALAADNFDFKDPKEGNSVTFKLTGAPNETIEGSANGISGTIAFDPANPAATKGKIVVASKSLTVPNAIMKSHLHSDQFLDVEKYPEISFEVKELKNARTEGEKISADAVGTFKLKDVSKELTVPVTLTYLKDKLGDRIPGKKGDLLVVRANFSIRRSDFSLNPHLGTQLADKIDLTLGIAGAAAK